MDDKLLSVYFKDKVNGTARKIYDIAREARDIYDVSDDEKRKFYDTWFESGKNCLKKYGFPVENFGDYLDELIRWTSLFNYDKTTLDDILKVKRYLFLILASIPCDDSGRIRKYDQLITSLQHCSGLVTDIVQFAEL
jgi:hypothetical protein